MARGDLDVTNQRPDTTLADYFRMIKRRRFFIAAVALVCAAAALGLSLLQKPSYTATALLTIRDPNQDLTLLGTSFVSGQTPLQLATAHAPSVTREGVVKAVKKHLPKRIGRAMTLTQVRQSVAVSVDANSDLVMITASSRKPLDAALLANGFAAQDAALSTADARAGYAEAARKLSARIHGLKDGRDATTKAIYIDQLSRLQDLSSVATPVAINATARVPSSPSSPKPVRNTIAALIFGLLLGIVLAYGREVLDRRLRRSSDVEQCFDQPVVGHIRASALGHAGAVSQNGSSNGSKSNGRGKLDDSDQESFRVLRQNVRYLTADDDLRTVLVTSAMAQEGKSTVAACLAAATAAAGRRTLLVECDLRRPVLSKRFGLAAKPGLTDYLTGHAPLQDVAQTVATSRPTFTTNGNGNGNGAPQNNGNGNGNGNGVASAGSSQPLYCIVSGTPAPRPAELLASDRFHAFLEEVRKDYDTVILDSAPLLAVADSLELVPSVDGILLCVRLDQTTRDQARAARTALERLPQRPTAVVLTNAGDKGDGYYGYYTQYATAN
jgi:Mrp family chromosome partitioning ATPase/capsular polysaccharide biosynthesis protein